LIILFSVEKSREFSAGIKLLFNVGWEKTEKNLTEDKPMSAFVGTDAF